MNFESMKQTIKDIELLEKDLMRPLTDEEKDLVINKGWREFLESIYMGDYNYKMLKEMKKVLMVLFTKPDEEYEDLINILDPEVGKVFRKIGDDILGHRCSEVIYHDKCTCHVDPIQDAIRKLKEGEVLELDEELQEEVIDWLWEHEDNVRIEVRNGKLRLR